MKWQPIITTDSMQVISQIDQKSSQILITEKDQSQYIMRSIGREETLILENMDSQILPFLNNDYYMMIDRQYQFQHISENAHEPISGRPSLQNFRNTVFHDNSANPNLAFSKSFQTFLGCVFFKGKIFMVFEHFRHSMKDVLLHLSKQNKDVHEDILMKVLKQGCLSLACCRQHQMSYPEFCLDNLFVTETRPAQAAPPGPVVASPKNAREFKFMHPFLLKSFFVQIEMKNNGDQLGQRNCKWR